MKIANIFRSINRNGVLDLVEQAYESSLINKEKENYVAQRLADDLFKVPKTDVLARELNKKVWEVLTELPFFLQKKFRECNF